MQPGRRAATPVKRTACPSGNTSSGLTFRPNFRGEEAGPRSPRPSRQPRLTTAAALKPERALNRRDNALRQIARWRDGLGAKARRLSDKFIAEQALAERYGAAQFLADTQADDTGATRCELHLRSRPRATLPTLRRPSRCRTRPRELHLRSIPAAKLRKLRLRCVPRMWPWTPHRRALPVAKLRGMHPHPRPRARAPTLRREARRRTSAQKPRPRAPARAW